MPQESRGWRRFELRYTWGCGQMVGFRQQIFQNYMNFCENRFPDKSYDLHKSSIDSVHWQDMMHRSRDCV